MAVVIVVGAQWGDEGKGKVVDLLTEHADAVVRYGGGANAGHTLVVGGEKTVIRLVPSGALHPKPKCVLGPGMVVDPMVLVEELSALESRGFDRGRVLLSGRAHVVLPHHILVDQLREAGPRAIGTTKRGVGPAYEDKVARRGVRVADMLDASVFAERLAANLAAWAPVVKALGGELPTAESVIGAYAPLAETLRANVGDAEGFVAELRERGADVVLEGAQGTMLDIDHGTYPYVTSSTVLAGGACSGAGLAPTHIDRVIGITKAYTTRVGSGPFPTELHGEAGDALRKAGGEFGAVTGRPRRCGWLDLPVLRQAVRLNGITDLAITKLDVLAGLPSIKLCVAYELDGQRLDHPPPVGFDRAVPIYEELPGWTGDLRGARAMSDLPANVRRYIDRVAELARCQISLVSIGPDRAQTIELLAPFRPR